MTIGEKLSQHYPCKQDDGVYEFKYAIEGKDGGILYKPFKGRLDHEFVAAEDGSDYVFGKPMKGCNMGVRKIVDGIILKYAKFDIVKQETLYIFRSMLVGIAVHQCKMLSPIHIYTDHDKNGDLRITGEALIDFNEVRPIDKLKNTK